VRPAGGGVAGRLAVTAALMLALLPACGESERLVLIWVTLADGVNPDTIASLQARTSPHFNLEPPVDIRCDAGRTCYPMLLGIYLHSHSGPVDVHVFAYPSHGEAVASGKLDGIDGFGPTPTLLLYPCIAPESDKTMLCQMPPTPDAGTDADAGADVKDAADAADGNTRSEVGDDRPPDERPETGDAHPDERPDVIDVAMDTPDATDADALIDTGVDQSETGDIVDAPPETNPDGADADVAPSACTTYCTGIVRACSALFSGEPQCELSCAAANLDSDSMACRIGNIEAAANDPTKCAEASLASPDCPSGGCIVYCLLGASVCGDALFSLSDCLSIACDPNLPFGDAQSPRSTDSLLCRMAWLQDAIEDPDLCLRAQPTGPCQAH